MFLDGGIRRGTDVFKALALGASGVFVLSPGERETDYKFTAGFDVRKKFGENDK